MGKEGFRVVLLWVAEESVKGVFISKPWYTHSPDVELFIGSEEEGVWSSLASNILEACLVSM